MLTPNSAGLSPDARTLYVAEAHASRVGAFAIPRARVRPARDLRTASITGKFCRCRWPRPGLKLAFNA
jgi:sugar lactone lactonase YvrE